MTRSQLNDRRTPQYSRESRGRTKTDKNRHDHMEDTLVAGQAKREANERTQNGERRRRQRQGWGERTAVPSTRWTRKRRREGHGGAGTVQSDSLLFFFLSSREANNKKNRQALKSQIMHLLLRICADNKSKSLKQNVRKSQPKPKNKKRPRACMRAVVAAAATHGVGRVQLLRDYFFLGLLLGHHPEPLLLLLVDEKQSINRSINPSINLCAALAPHPCFDAHEIK